MIELVTVCVWPLAIVLVAWLVMRSFETGAMEKLAERFDTLEGDAKLQESRVLELQAERDNFADGCVGSFEEIHAKIDGLAESLRTATTHKMSLFTRVEDLEGAAKAAPEPAAVTPSWLEERVERLEKHTSNLTVTNVALRERVHAVDEDCSQLATDLEALEAGAGADRAAWRDRADRLSDGISMVDARVTKLGQS